MDGNAIWYSVRLGLEEGRTRDAVDRLIGWHRSDGSLIVPDWTGRPGPDRIHYPIQFFDVLFALQVMADLGRLGEPRCSDALEVSRGSYAGWGPSGLRRCNPLVTLAALAVLRAQTAGQQAGSEG